MIASNCDPENLRVDLSHTLDHTILSFGDLGRSKALAPSILTPTPSAPSLPAPGATMCGGIAELFILTLTGLQER